jgi:adenylylsulfate kinase-like enzyme
MIVWLTGRSGAGKTAICKELLNNTSLVHLDDDNISDILIKYNIIPDVEHNIESYTLASLALAEIAMNISNQGNLVLVSSMLPLQCMRDRVDALCKPLWVTVKKDDTSRSTDLYQTNGNYPSIDNAVNTLSESVNLLIDIIKG